MRISKEGNKKVLILYILKMIEEGSSVDMPIKKSSMMKVLHSMDIPCDYKTICRNIDYLIDFGYDIAKIKGGKVYMYNKTL